MKKVQQTPQTGHMSHVAAIIVAGGRGERLGGVDKPRLEVGGSTMRARVLRAAREALGPHAPLIVVGAPGPDLALFGHVRVVREEPLFSGPVAALARGLQEVEKSTHILLLGGDMPRLNARVLTAMAERAGGEHAEQVSMARDAQGRAQFLCALWPTAILGDALAELRRERREQSGHGKEGGHGEEGGDSGLAGVSMTRLYGQVSDRLQGVDLDPTAARTLRDVDDPDELAAARAEFQS